MKRSAIAALLVVLSLCPAASAAFSDHDSRPLRAEERKVFLSLLCRKQQARAENCVGLASYPGHAPASVSLTLGAVIVGGVTRPGADQAYVTYAGDFEPHVNNFGGGILFERIRTEWRLVRWYPGGQMDHCVALPMGPSQGLLCLAGYTGQGEVDTSVWLERVPASGGSEQLVNGMVGVLKAQDTRNSGVAPLPGNDQCSRKHAKGEAILLSIGDLGRTDLPGYLAEASVTYATARDVAAACRGDGFARVQETKGLVRFRLKGARVQAVSPVKFAPTDY